MNIEIEINITTDNPKWNDFFNHMKDLPFNMAAKKELIQQITRG